MFYLIPNWEKDSLNLDYDVILNYALMLEENDEPYVLVTDTFSPFLPYQLNRFNLLHSCYFQTFDAIQGVSSHLGKPLALEDLPELDGLERIYSPSGIILAKDGVKVAFAEMFADQFLQKITYFSNENQRIDQFDARGFLARRQFLLDSKLQKEVLYDPTGEAVLNIDYTAADQVTILAHSKRFDKTKYTRMDDLKLEVLEKYFAKESNQPRIITAIGPENKEVTKKLNQNYQLALAFNDTDYHNRDLMKAALALNAPMLLPSSNIATQVQQISGNNPANLQVVSPYTTKLDLGNSNSNDTQIILWYIRSMDSKRFAKMAVPVIQMIVADEDLALTIDTPAQAIFNSSQALIKQAIENFFQISLDSEDFQWVQHYLQQKARHLVTVGLAKEAKMRKQKSNWKRLIKAAETVDRIRVQGNSSVDFYDYEFNRIRVLVDLSQVPDTYLQVKAISAGIPQINHVATQFVKNYQNGIVIKEDDKLVAALQYFVHTLKNWNQALVDNVKEISAFSGAANIKKLKSIFKDGGA
ncbi:accessory Sec system protein Asp1 [Fructilactobacillus carniphilus]|uniref:Accessory Sec system protein Asp1 n=1 Tax=Fructilactobacillus carniphilus TaxID=2940297 RepID=A0ABY5BW15_9LACO|nr:accessory Sec system protein Asp1 [Fructilactobacillus carniphilus]USS90030.1 accessory Sec system protein Asp1 [Fructilactobacillus carniphilus]